MGDNFKLVTFSAAPFKPHDLHREAVSSEQALECHTCGRRFYGKFELKRHTNAVHDPSAKKKCPETGCQAKMKRDDKRRKHMKDRHPGADFRKPWLSDDGSFECADDGTRTGDIYPGSKLPLPDSSASLLLPQGGLDAQGRSILQYGLACLGVVPQSIDGLSIETKFAIEEFLAAQVPNRQYGCFQSQASDSGQFYAGHRNVCISSPTRSNSDPAESATVTAYAGSRLRDHISRNNEHWDTTDPALGCGQKSGVQYSDAAMTMRSDRLDDNVPEWEIEDLFNF